MELENSVVLVTGGAKGLGLAISTYLQELGSQVVVVDVDSEALASVSKTFDCHLLNVTDPDNVKVVVKEVIKKYARIDVLVNNAGFGLVSTAEEVTDEEIFKQFDVNVFGLMKMTRTVLPYMREAKAGVIINISSFLGKMGLPLLSHYNASKYAVEGFVDSIRFEMAPYNVRVHSIQSGLFGTNFVKKGLVANSATTSENSPYKDLVAHFVPIVAKAINEGPSPQPIADAVKAIIEDENSLIAIPVGAEATSFVPLRKELSDEDFEVKAKETFGI